MILTPGHGALPSGHATEAYLISMCLAQVMPAAASASTTGVAATGVSATGIFARRDASLASTTGGSPPRAPVNGRAGASVGSRRNAVRAANRFREYRTLVSLRGACPKCGTEQEFGETGRMKNPHAVHCASCRWELRVDVPLSGAAT